MGTLQHIHSTWPEESHVPKSERPASRSTSSTLQKLSSSSSTRRRDWCRAQTPTSWTSSAQDASTSPPSSPTPRPSSSADPARPSFASQPAVRLDRPRAAPSAARHKRAVSRSLDVDGSHRLGPRLHSLACTGEGTKDRRRKQASEQSKAKQWWDGSLFHHHPAAWRHRAGWQAKMTEGTHERETRELSLLSFTNDTYLIPAPTVIPCTAYGPASVSPSQAYSVSATQ